MNFIQLTLSGGYPILLDKKLIIFVIDYKDYRQITLSDTREFSVENSFDEIHSLLFKQ